MGRGEGGRIVGLGGGRMGLDECLERVGVRVGVDEDMT